MRRPSRDVVGSRAAQFASCAAAAAAGWLLTACGAEAAPRESRRTQLQSRSGTWSGSTPKQYGTPVTVADTPAMPGVEFAYALDISRCIGCRRCVYACVEENNQSRDPQVHWIRVFSMDKEKGVDFSARRPVLPAEEVPEEGHFYVPVACQQCRNAPCTKVCPTGATWTEPDGIVVIDYDWCIGCRYCMAACPYGARHFNWGEPTIPSGQLNPKTHSSATGRGRRAWSRSARSASSGRATAAIRPASRCARSARGSSATCSTRRARSATSSSTSACCVLKEDLNTLPKFFYFYAT